MSQFPHHTPKVNVRPQRKCMLSGINDKINILFEMSTPAELVEGIEEGGLKGKERPAIDLAIVLDRSGSMEGDKSNFAKKAIIEIINTLGPQDRLHFVVYWDIIQVIFSDAKAENKEDLIRMVNEISNGGSTNMSGGITKGFELLKNRPSNVLRRIFLFSDGIANAGTTSSQQLFQLVDSFYKLGVTTSCFGLGEDFDEVILRGISERGSGDYFFIQSPENIPKYVSTAIKGLTRLVGLGGTFTLTGEHGTIATIYGADGSDKYHFGDIVANEQINIVAAIEVDDSPKINGTNSSIVAKWEVSYQTNSTQPEQKSYNGHIIMEFTTELAAAEEQDEEVILAVKIKEFGAKEREGKILYEDGKLAEVIDLRKSYIIELKEYEEKDSTGRITKLIESAAKQLSNLESELAEKKLLSTLTPAQHEFYRKFGRLPPPERKRPIVQKKRTYFDSAEWSLQKNEPTKNEKPSNFVPLLSPSSMKQPPSKTDSPTSPTSPSSTSEDPSDKEPQQQPPNSTITTKPPNYSRNSVRKFFDSAEYLCLRDSTFSWKNAHVSIQPTITVSKPANHKT
jgi:hypothetical protein